MTGRRRRAATGRWPGSNRDRRRSAKLARALVLLDPAASGVIYVVLPHTVTSGNVELLRAVAPLQAWGAVWLLCAAGIMTRGREGAYALLALTYGAAAVLTGATALTGTMDAPAAPFRLLALAGVAWWLRARAVARADGTLHGDDLTLRG